MPLKNFLKYKLSLKNLASNKAKKGLSTNLFLLFAIIFVAVRIFTSFHYFSHQFSAFSTNPHHHHQQYSKNYYHDQTYSYYNQIKQDKKQQNSQENCYICDLFNLATAILLLSLPIITTCLFLNFFTKYRFYYQHKSLYYFATAPPISLSSL